MKYDFEPGEKIRIGDSTTDFYFIAQFGETVYATLDEPGQGENASAYTYRSWKRAPKPFFEVQKTYRYPGYSTRYTIHHVFEMDGKRYAAALNTCGDESIWNESEFSEMEEA